MPNPQDIFQLAQQTATQVTASPENWRRFLYTAAHNYHTTYLNQLLIHAQRPDATACATMKYWNEQAHRKVMYGSKSIIIANSRCDSFASGGSFDHSGAVCGEIIAAGPFASASSVCAAWQSSPDHYASIVSPNYSSMGIGCWFCSTEAGQYTYWAVTFQ